MTKLTLTNVANFQNESSAVTTLAQNNVATVAAIENTISRDGTLPNHMNAQLDMNSNKIINLPDAISAKEPLTLGQYNATIGTLQTGTAVQGSYVTMSPEPGLLGERVLTAGSNIILTDGGAGTTATIAVAASPAFTGVPTSPTAAPATNTTQIATTAFVLANGTTLSALTPTMAGVAAVGVATTASHGDHVHPTDTSRASLVSPAFTTVPTAPTALVGTNSNQIATTAFVLANGGSGGSKKNYILNGAMMVSQENGTTAVTVTAQYPVDMFDANFLTDGACSVAQVASVTAGGSPNRLRVTVTTADTSMAAAQVVYIRQKMEGYRTADLKFGTASAKTITIQFGCKGPAGTYTVSIWNGAFTRYYVAEYVISGGEANTDVVKSVTLVGDTIGTWATGNTSSLHVFWALAAGSNFHGTVGSWNALTINQISSVNQFNFMGTNGNTFELFDVSLTEGSVAPLFQVQDYSSELLACRRYFQFMVGAYGLTLGVGAWQTATVCNVYFQLPVVMRVSPTFSIAAAAGDYFISNGGGGFVSVASIIATFGFQPSGGILGCTSTGGLVGGAGLLTGQTGFGVMKFNARL